MWVQCLWVAPKRGVACKFALTEWGTESAHKGWTGIRLQALMQLARSQSQQLREFYVFILLYKLFYFFYKKKDYLTSLQHPEVNVEFALVIEQPFHCLVLQSCLLWHEISRKMENCEIHHEDSDFHNMWTYTRKTNKKLTFNQNEDVEDTFRTCPEEKNYNIPE